LLQFACSYSPVALFLCFNLRVVDCLKYMIVVDMGIISSLVYMTGVLSFFFLCRKISICADASNGPSVQSHTGVLSKNYVVKYLKCNYSFSKSHTTWCILIR